MANQRAVLVKRGYRFPAGTSKHRFGRQACKQLRLVIPRTHGEIAVESNDRIAGADGYLGCHGLYSLRSALQANRAASADVVRRNTECFRVIARKRVMSLERRWLETSALEVQYSRVSRVSSGRML